jgi:2,5-furandicarboxylate decarboxylase 1
VQEPSSNSGVLDTRFRSALERMARQGRLQAYTAKAHPHLEIAAIMKNLDGGPALMFTNAVGFDVPIVVPGQLRSGIWH